MKFRFPVIIIDEDWKSESSSGLGIRALAKAIEDQGIEVVGGFTYVDVTMVANQAARASAFVVSIDDEEIGEEGEESTAIKELKKFIVETRRRNADIPIFLFGETRTSQHIPNEILKELHGFIHMFEDTPEFVARYIIREATNYLNSLAPPFFKALVHYANDGSYSWHCPGHSGGVAFLKSPVGQMFHQFFGENMLRADVCNAVDELGQLLDHTGPVAASERNAARIFGSRSPVLRHQRHLDLEQDRLALGGRHRRRRAGRPQLPQVDPARDHDDRHRADLPAADAQPSRHHRADSASRSSSPTASAARSRPIRW